MKNNNGDQKNPNGIDFESMMQAMMDEMNRQVQGTCKNKNDGKNKEDPLSEKSLSAEKGQAILNARAQALARITQEASGEMTQLVVFSLATETYGIATHLVREVQPLRDVSAVPCTPSFVIGVINIRGAIYSVVDIRDFLGVPSQEITDSTKVILVNAANLEVGILADDVLGEISVPLSGIKPPLATRGGIKEEYIEGVTRDMLSILNLEELMRDERFIIHEEVG